MLMGTNFESLSSRSERMPKGKRSSKTIIKCVFGLTISKE